MSPGATEVAAEFCAARASLTKEQRWACDLYEEAENGRHFTNAPISARLERLFEREAASRNGR